MYASTKIFCKTLANKKCIPVHLSPETRRKFRRKLNGKMGMIHTEDTRKTLAEIAAENGWKYDTLWRKAKRVFPAESWTAETPVPASVADALLSSDRRKKPAQAKRPARNPKQQPASVHQPPAPASGVSTPAPGRAKMAWPVFGLSEFLALAVYGHTALVWYEVSLIFATPGILAGVVLFALKHCAVVVCRSEKFADYHSDAFGVAFVLDALAVWVHYTAFGDAMPARFKDGAEFWAALILGLVVAAGAFMALYFTEKTAKQ